MQLGRVGVYERRGMTSGGQSLQRFFIFGISVLDIVHPFSRSFGEGQVEAIPGSEVIQRVVGRGVDKQHGLPQR